METPGDMQDTQQPTLCVTGCGFFANCGSGGMCSKCFRETQAAEQAQQRATESMVKAASAAALDSSVAAAAPAAAASSQRPVPPPAETTPDTAMLESSSPATAAAAPASSAAAAAAAAPDATPEAAAPTPAAACKTPTRCQQCRKKVGLTGFTCKCGLLFCGQHRYAEAHECSFDYKTTQREKLAAANPVVQAAKVERI